MVPANVVTPANIVQGPADLYTGVFGVTEPTDANINVVPGAGWTGIGGTQGGVNFEVDNTYDQINVDQLIDPVGARLTKRAIQVTFKLAEATLANLQLSMNQLMTQGSGGNFATSDPQTTTSATQPTYTALLVDGWAPTLASGAAARRRLIVRKALSQAKVQFAYTLQNNAVYDITFTAYYVSPSVSPFHITDQTA